MSQWPGGLEHGGTSMGTGSWVCLSLRKEGGRDQRQTAGKEPGNCRVLEDSERTWKRIGRKGKQSRAPPDGLGELIPRMS